MAVLLGASPSEFGIGDVVTLTAAIRYVSTNTAFTGYHVQVAFVNVSSDGTNTTHVAVSGLDGVAVWSLQYPSDGKAHAFLAKIISQYVGLELRGI